MPSKKYRLAAPTDVIPSTIPKISFVPLLPTLDNEKKIKSNSRWWIVLPCLLLIFL
jgi:hypothetical protein